jgi:hypothetical protein
MTGPLEQLWRAQGMGDREQPPIAPPAAAEQPVAVPAAEEQPVAAPTAGDMDYPSGESNGRLRVREYGPEDGYAVGPRPDPIEQAARLRSPAEEQPVQLRPEDGGAPAAAAGAEAVATRLLAEVLALDLGTMTPIRALTLLHELQTQAREAVPWSSWMASMAGARESTEKR